MINWSSIHSFCEFHNRVAKIRVASKDGGFDRGSTAIFWKFGGVEIKDTFRFKEL